ncbi:ribonuclease H-like domain-containing protein [Tanacetum coccineum]
MTCVCRHALLFEDIGGDYNIAKALDSNSGREFDDSLIRAANDHVAEWGDYNIAKALDSNSGREFDDSLIREKKSASNIVKDLKIISARNIIKTIKKGRRIRSAMFDVLGTDTAYLLLYVDDIVPTASSESLLQQIIRSLHQEFAMTYLGSLNYFLGISVTCDSSGLFLSQKKYAIEILDRAHMDNYNPSRTPIDTESKLGSDVDPVSDPTLYRSLAGSLQYLTFTRPNISYAFQQLFSSFTTYLVVYSDADWAGCPTTRRSTAGYCVFLGNNLLFWSSKRQPTLSRSSAEAEYRGITNAIAETCWLHNLLRELHTLLSSATLVYCDNVSAVYLSCNPVLHQRTNHIEIDIHFVRDLVAAG